MAGAGLFPPSDTAVGVGVHYGASGTLCSEYPSYYWSKSRSEAVFDPREHIQRRQMESRVQIDGQHEFNILEVTFMDAWRK